MYHGMRGIVQQHVGGSTLEVDCWTRRVLETMLSAERPLFAM